MAGCRGDKPRQLSVNDRAAAVLAYWGPRIATKAGDHPAHARASIDAKPGSLTTKSTKCTKIVMRARLRRVASGRVVAVSRSSGTVFSDLKYFPSEFFVPFVHFVVSQVVRNAG